MNKIDGSFINIGPRGFSAEPHVLALSLLVGGRASSIKPIDVQETLEDA